MRRKNKRIAKINQTSSVSGESDTTNLTGPDSESQEIANVPNDEIDCKLDSELSQIESNNTKSDSTEDETTIKQEMTSTESTFLFVELKLISIDYKCVQYSNLIQKFLCINSDACIHHINKFIAKNMNIIDDLFEIVLMCNGFEVKNKCPLLFLKNRFFSNQETIVLYYAIVERK